MITTLARLLRAGSDPRSTIDLALAALQATLPLRGAQILQLDGARPAVLAEAGEWIGPALAIEERLALDRARRGQLGVAASPSQVLLWVPLCGPSPGWLLGCARAADALFTDTEIDQIQVLGSAFIFWLERTRLRRDLGEVEEDSLRALAAALASRDRYTGTHVDAVCVYAERLAQALGLSAEAQRVVRMGSMLHDVGKIGVNDAILQKAGPLTEMEMMQMRQHTIIGAQIVRNVRRLQPALPVVLYHHERWDGQGYPSGLLGAEIPLEARIVAVVDSFHAMTSTRPYRRARSEAEALAELQRGAGAAFDPAIVTTFSLMISRAEGEDPRVLSR